MAGATAEADLPRAQDVMRLLTQLSCNCHSIADNTLDNTGIKLGACLPARTSQLRRWLSTARVGMVADTTSSVESCARLCGSTWCGGACWRPFRWILNGCLL